MARLSAGATLGAFVLAGNFVAVDVHGGPATDVDSVFFIAKSENRNQVHYGIHLDSTCTPVGANPVHAYWRMNEKGGAIEPLLPIEEQVYGLDSPQYVVHEGDNSRVTLRVRGIASRVVTIHVGPGPEGCRAVGFVEMKGTLARLTWVYLKTRWPGGIEYVLIRGRRSGTGEPIEERVGLD
jgi:hypothetical protein